jgi:hypothetical protein
VPSDDFTRFWLLYPKRVARQDAVKAWCQLNPSPTLVEEILAALDWQRRQPDWQRDNHRYVPYPATWLRHGRWQDEPVVVEDPFDALQARAERLVEHYAELYREHRHGARYRVMPLDVLHALALVRVWLDDTRLDKLAVIVLTTDDEWVSRTDRGFGVFASRASWADDRLTAWELAHQVQT